MRYDNLIWDFDGTLFDTYPPMCRDLQAAMEQLGLHFTLEELLERFTSSREEVLAYCGARAGRTADEIDTVYRAWVTAHGQPQAQPFPHVREVLARFQAAGGRNFVFTHRSGSVHDYLAQADLTRYFTEVVSAGATFARKPAPAGNLYLMEKYGLDPARTLAVGDRELDILAGKNAGADACLFAPGGAEAETAADYQILDYRQLYALVGLSQALNEE